MHYWDSLTQKWVPWSFKPGWGDSADFWRVLEEHNPLHKLLLCCNELRSAVSAYFQFAVGAQSFWNQKWIPTAGQSALQQRGVSERERELRASSILWQLCLNAAECSWSRDHCGEVRCTKWDVPRYPTPFQPCKYWWFLDSWRVWEPWLHIKWNKRNKEQKHIHKISHSILGASKGCFRQENLML